MRSLEGSDRMNWRRCWCHDGPGRKSVEEMMAEVHEVKAAPPRPGGLLLVTPERSPFSYVTSNHRRSSDTNCPAHRLAALPVFLFAGAVERAAACDDQPTVVVLI